MIFVCCIQSIEHVSQRHPIIFPSAISQYLSILHIVQIRTVHRKSGKTVAKVLTHLIVIDKLVISFVENLERVGCGLTYFVPISHHS